jgi:AcrR family transcriptional regulator
MPSAHDRSTTRERILDAAFDLFVEQGFSGTTISEVERRVGLAAGTGSFYRHFSSKEALLLAAVEREVTCRMAEAKADRDALPQVIDPREQFTVSAQQTLRDLRRFDRLFRLMLTDGHRIPDVRNAITTALQGSGAVNWADDPVVVTTVAALLGFHVFGMIGDGPVGQVDQDDFIDALATLTHSTGLQRSGSPASPNASPPPLSGTGVG